MNSWTPGHGLGRRPSLNKEPRKLISELELEIPQEDIKKKYSIPKSWIPFYDQGNEGSCVGFGSSWAMSLKNKSLYQAYWLYQQAQLVDEWPDTPPQEGTSVHAATQILLTKGHRKTNAGNPSIKEGIKAVRFSEPGNVVNDIRTSIKHDMPVIMGINWYQNFDQPYWDVQHGWIIGSSPNLGSIRGGHCVCAYGVDDTLGMVNVVNNWGFDYPLVKMPYETIERLDREDGEFAILTDR